MTFASVRHLLASGRCAWMLALALCLPLAQLATAAHALQHLANVATEDREAPAQVPPACDLCVAAAAIGGAAPLPATQALAPVVLASAQPADRSVAQRIAPVLPSYSSRAPPLLHA